MNQGAFLIDRQFATEDELQRLLAQIPEELWQPTHPEGAYASDRWRVIKLISKGERTKDFEKFLGLAEITDRFQCHIKMMTFYSILPGGTLHPHRDLSGAWGIGCIRLHVPMQTNPKLDFRVSRRPVSMKPGELWALDTSYLHSVANRGDEDRIHLVLEVEANPWLLKKLPRVNLRGHAHQAFFFGLIGMRAAQSVTYNLAFDRTKFRNHLDMGRGLIKALRKRYFS